MFLEEEKNYNIKPKGKGTPYVLPVLVLDQKSPLGVSDSRADTQTEDNIESFTGLVLRKLYFLPN